MIPESNLNKFLASDFKKDLPNDFECGGTDTVQLVEDYIAYRKYNEACSK